LIPHYFDLASQASSVSITVDLIIIIRQQTMTTRDAASTTSSSVIIVAPSQPLDQSSNTDSVSSTDTTDRSPVIVVKKRPQQKQKRITLMKKRCRTVDCNYTNPLSCTTAIVNAEGIGPRTRTNLRRHASYNTVSHYEVPQQETIDRCIATMAGNRGLPNGGTLAIAHDDDNDMNQKMPAVTTADDTLVTNNTSNANNVSWEQDSAMKPTTLFAQAGGGTGGDPDDCDVNQSTSSTRQSAVGGNNNAGVHHGSSHGVKKTRIFADCTNLPDFIDPTTYEYCMNIAAAESSKSHIAPPHATHHAPPPADYHANSKSAATVTPYHQPFLHPAPIPAPAQYYPPQYKRHHHGYHPPQGYPPYQHHGGCYAPPPPPLPPPPPPPAYYHPPPPPAAYYHLAPYHLQPQQHPMMMTTPAVGHHAPMTSSAPTTHEQGPNRPIIFVLNANANTSSNGGAHVRPPNTRCLKLLHEPIPKFDPYYDASAETINLLGGEEGKEGTAVSQTRNAIGNVMGSKLKRPPGVKAAKREKREWDDDSKSLFAGFGTEIVTAVNERDLYDMASQRYNHYVAMGNIKKADEMEEQLDYLMKLRRERVAEQQAKKKAASRQEPPPPAPPAVTPANRCGSTAPGGDHEEKEEEPVTNQEEEEDDDDEELVMFDNEEEEEEEDGQHQAQAQY
jgi:hypothetical protein